LHNSGQCLVYAIGARQRKVRSDGMVSDGMVIPVWLF
jgi:hypothetical protein